MTDVKYDTHATNYEDATKRVYDIVRPGISWDESNDKYTQWAKAYGNDLKIADYNGPYYVAEKTLKILGDRKDAHIIDIAAGTGLVGEHLKKFGFTNVDAVEPNKAMLDEAKAHNLYRQYTYALVTEKPLDIPAEQYDATIMCGAFIEGHMQPKLAVPEFYRLTKKGGYMVFIVMKDDEFRKSSVRDELDATLKLFKDAGKISLVSEEVVQNYLHGKPCCLYVCQKL